MNSSIKKLQELQKWNKNTVTKFIADTDKQLSDIRCLSIQTGMKEQDVYVPSEMAHLISEFLSSELFTFNEAKELDDKMFTMVGMHSSRTKIDVYHVQSFDIAAGENKCRLVRSALGMSQVCFVGKTLFGGFKYRVPIYWILDADTQLTPLLKDALSK